MIKPFKLIKFHIIPFTVLLTFSAFTRADISYHSSASGNNYKIVEVAKTYTQAKAFCLSLGGHLAVMNSIVEASDIGQMIASYTDTYFIMGSTIAASSTVKTNVTNEVYYDPSPYSEAGDIGTSSTIRYLTYSANVLPTLQWETSTTATYYSVCEWESDDFNG